MTTSDGVRPRTRAAETDGARPRARAAEAVRNREALVAAATRAFASSPTADGANGGAAAVSLEAIAKDAGVGIGTLYRHFPQREALVEAVYADQIARLHVAARRLVTQRAPESAFREWTAVFVDWAVTKRGMVDALAALMTSGRVTSGQMRQELVAMVGQFLDAGVASGEFRTDVDATDVAAMLAGVLVVASAPEQRHQASRLANLVVDAVRTPA